MRTWVVATDVIPFPFPFPVPFPFDRCSCHSPIKSVDPISACYIKLVGPNLANDSVQVATSAMTNLSLIRLAFGVRIPKARFIPYLTFSGTRFPKLLPLFCYTVQLPLLMSSASTENRFRVGGPWPLCWHLMVEIYVSWCAKPAKCFFDRW